MSRSKKTKASSQDRAAASSAAVVAAPARFSPLNFPHPFHLGEKLPGPPAKSLLELKAMALSAAIRAKPQWETKMENPAILQRWKMEASEQKVEKEVMEYVLKELKLYAAKKQGPLEVGPVDGTWIADSIIPADLKAAFRAQAFALENVPDAAKDWHPGSDQQVLDLVHPSLFPLIYDVSLATAPSAPQLPWPECIGTGVELVRAPGASSNNKKKRPAEGVSTKYQWLPTDFSIGADGKVAINNYINNLHPDDHAALYGSIGSIFERFVPLFNNVLTDMLHFKDRERINRFPRKFVPNEVKEFPTDPDRVVNLNGHTVQVIVKMANIILTPDKPVYNGGAWHIEGMQEEHIIATGIYYYHTENITTSLLKFRQSVTADVSGSSDNQDEARFQLLNVYGLKEGDSLTQELGALEAKEDRCLVFPNLFQHRVSPFALQDPTKPGLRKILVFFLVDPNHKGHSTSTIPPQRRDWIHRELDKRSAFPSDLLKIVDNYADLGLTWEQAVEHRVALMHERKFFRKAVDEKLFSDQVELPEFEESERSFSLCEH